jgi:hypothetical protein
MSAPILSDLEKNPFISVRRMPLDVAIAYDGIDAALQAVDVINALKPRARAGAAIARVSVWWFKALEDAEQLRTATAAAVEADVLVVAANMGVELPRNVRAWLRESLAKSRRLKVAVVALLGGEDRRNRSGSPRFRSVQRIAGEAGALFFAPTSAPNSAVCGLRAEKLGQRKPSSVALGATDVMPYR